MSFNDFVAIFLRVTELRLDTSLRHLYGISEVFKKIEKEIVKEDEEEPSIGRLALCLQRSKICSVDLNKKLLEIRKERKKKIEFFCTFVELIKHEK